METAQISAGERRSSYVSWRRRFAEVKIAGLSAPAFVALLIFVAAGMIAALHHEPNADEAQGWLIARDFSVPHIIHAMRYEGTPPLWHLVLWFLIRLHLPYSALGLVSLTLLSGAMYVWLRYNPLPLAVGLLIPFCFFFQYEYAVVARSYSLATLLAFIAAALWRQERLEIIPLALVLALLVQTNLYGFAMGAGIAAGVAGEYIFRTRWGGQRRSFVAVSGALIAVGLSCLAAYYVARPALDNFDAVRYYTPISQQLSSPINPGILANPSAFLIVAVGYVIRLGMACRPLAAALALPWGIVAVACAFVVIWFIAVRRVFCLLPFLATLAAMHFVFWTWWHGGMALVALLVSLWVAWPEHTPVEARKLTMLLLAGLAIAVAIQIPSTFCAVKNEVVENSSPGKAAADFLKPIAGRRPIYAPGYRSGAILPYFSTNVFANRQSAAWIKSSATVESDGRVFRSPLPDGALLLLCPRYAPNVDPSTQHPESYFIQKEGLERTHLFCGKMIWFSGTLVTDCIDVYEHRTNAR